MVYFSKPCLKQIYYLFNTLACNLDAIIVQRLLDLSFKVLATLINIMLYIVTDRHMHIIATILE